MECAGHFAISGWTLLKCSDNQVNILDIMAAFRSSSGLVSTDIGPNYEIRACERKCPALPFDKGLAISVGTLCPIWYVNKVFFV